MKIPKMTNSKRQAIYRRDNFECVVCGSNRDLHIHHYIHRSQGGQDTPHNLATLCNICHNVIHNISMYTNSEWLLFPYEKEDVEQNLVEYLADLYASSGFEYNHSDLEAIETEFRGWSPETKKAVLIVYHWKELGHSGKWFD